LQSVCKLKRYKKIKMTVYGYTRLNTNRPRPKNLDPKDQVHAIKKWCEERGIKIKKIFHDTEAKSTSLELPNLKKLITLIEKGQVNLLIIARLDRFTRSIRVYQKLIKLFSDHKIRFISIAEGLDSSTKSGEKILEAMGIFALWDAKSIPDRTREMIERKRILGERVGHAPFGYTYKEKQLIPIIKELKIAKIIREKRELENLSYHKIAKLLNGQRIRAKRGGRWYAETIKSICENPLYERFSM